MDRITTRGSFNDPVKSRISFDDNGTETFVSNVDPLPTTIYETIPTNEAKLNPALTLTYDGSGNLTQIDKTIGSTVYRKTLTWTGSNLTDISTWSVV